MANQTHVLRSFAIVFIALVALLLPVAGPAVDHHFFERFAFHSHVYLGEPDLDHGHAYDSSSSAVDQEASTFIATSGEGPSTGALTLLADDPNNLESKIELEDGLIGRSGDEFNRPREIVIALPEKPPRPDSPVVITESVYRVGIG